MISAPESRRGTPSTALPVLKQRVSRRLRRTRRLPAGQLNFRFEREEDSLPRFWQRRFYDFTGAGSTWSPPEERLESEEENRKAKLHAHESGETKIGRPSQGLALERFFLLLEIQTGFDPYRPRQLSSGQAEKNVKPSAPSKTARSWAPASSTPKAAPPAKSSLLFLEKCCMTKTL
jgi:hypothetical protein